MLRQQRQLLQDTLCRSGKVSISIGSDITWGKSKASILVPGLASTQTIDLPAANFQAIVYEKRNTV